MNPDASAYDDRRPQFDPLRRTQTVSERSYPAVEESEARTPPGG